MQVTPVVIKGNISFRLRFNTMHGDTDLHWRVIVNIDNSRDEQEYLVRSLQCNVPTRSDASYDERAGAIKYNIAGVCSELVIDMAGKATLN